MLVNPADCHPAYHLMKTPASGFAIHPLIKQRHVLAKWLYRSAPVFSLSSRVQSNSDMRPITDLLRYSSSLHKTNVISPTRCRIDHDRESLNSQTPNRTQRRETVENRI